MADALSAGQTHGRRSAVSANGRRCNDVHCFRIIRPPMGILAAVRPRDFGTSRSQLYAELTISLRVRRRGALDQGWRVRREVADIEHSPIRKKNARVGSLERHDLNQPKGGPQAACLVDTEPRAARLGASALGGSIPQCNWGGSSTILAIIRRGWQPRSCGAGRRSPCLPPLGS